MVKLIKRGQAAMEFLMTYGWAILVVLIAIGALAYFGVLNPGRFLPKSCTLIPGLDCSEFKVSASATQVQLFLRDGLGSSIDFSSLNIDLNSDGVGDCTVVDPAAIPDGALSAQINIDGCTIGAVGSRFRGDVVGTYKLGSETLTHTLTGTVITQVEA